MPNSAQLDLPYLMASQAQKHVTHNEALRRLDALVQLRVQDFDQLTPPGLPETGAVHALGAAPVGAWAGQPGMLAVWDGSAWEFIAPQQGWRAWGIVPQAFRVWDGAGWVAVTGAQDNLDHLGVNTTADAVNRLAVRAEGTLLSHDGADHRLTVNKAGGSDTASLLFQSGWTGHAEIGLAGDTDLSVKVSPDGSAWTEALVVDAASGHVTGAAVQSGASDTTPGRLARADYAYGPGNVTGTVSQSGGTPTGAVLEGNNNGNGDYVRFADGTQICCSVVQTSAGAPFTRTWPAAFVAAPRVALSSGGGTAVIATSTNNSTTSVDLYAFNASGAQIVAYVSVIAMGRWF